MQEYSENFVFQLLKFQFMLQILRRVWRFRIVLLYFYKGRWLVTCMRKYHLLFSLSRHLTNTRINFGPFPRIYNTARIWTMHLSRDLMFSYLPFEFQKLFLKFAGFEVWVAVFDYVRLLPGSFWQGRRTNFRILLYKLIHKLLSSFFIGFKLWSRFIVITQYYVLVQTQRDIGIV